MATIEIGGGTGVFLLSLINRSNDVHFSDISREQPVFKTPKKLVDLSSSNNKNVNYLLADATDLPYEDNTFDKIFVMDVLEHIPDESDAIEEIARVTASGGKLILSAPIEIGFPLLVREVYRKIDGNRRLTKSFSELVRAILRNPIDISEGHRGYDYRQTISRIESEFTDTSVEYCPFPKFGTINPTAIVSASF